MNLIKKAFYLLMLCLLALAMGGCGGNAKKTPRVAIAFPSSSESWQRGGDTLRDALEKEGFTVSLKFARTGEEQLAQLESQLDQDPKYLIVGVVDSKAVAEALETAQRKNIPVIAYDRLILGSKAVSFNVSFNNEKVGFLMGEYLEKALDLRKDGPPVNIEFFAGDPADNNSKDFFGGALKVLKPYIDRGRVAVPSGEVAFQQVVTRNWSRDIARERMADILKRHYRGGRRLAAVLAPNDNLAAGIREALGDGFRDKWPLITGQDADPEGLQAIAAGRQAMTIYKDPALLSRQCVVLLKRLEAGEDLDASAPVRLDNGVKAVPAYLCTPVCIEKANLADVNSGKSSNN